MTRFCAGGVLATAVQRSEVVTSIPLLLALRTRRNLPQRAGTGVPTPAQHRGMRRVFFSSPPWSWSTPRSTRRSCPSCPITRTSLASPRQERASSPRPTRRGRWWPRCRRVAGGADRRQAHPPLRPSPARGHEPRLRLARRGARRGSLRAGRRRGALLGGRARLADRGGPPDSRGELIGGAISAVIGGVLLGPVLGAAAVELGPASVFSGVAVLAACLAAWAAHPGGRRDARRAPS